MDSTDAPKRMVRMSGKPSSQIAREIGRAESFVRATISQGTRPRVDTFAEIATACGYEVVLRSRSDEFTLNVGAPHLTVEHLPHDDNDNPDLS